LQYSNSFENFTVGTIYRWRVEEYHKIFKSDVRMNDTGLRADGMAALIGFLSVIAAELYS